MPHVYRAGKLGQCETCHEPYASILHNGSPAPEPARAVVRVVEVDGRLYEYRGLPDVGMERHLVTLTVPLELARQWRLARMRAEQLEGEILRGLTIEQRAEIKAKAIRR